MVGLSVSLPTDLYEKMRKRALSPSKVFRIGLDVAINGGTDFISDMRKQIEIQKEKAEIKDMKIKELEKRVENLKENGEWLRSELDKHLGLAKKEEE